MASYIFVGGVKDATNVTYAVLNSSGGNIVKRAVGDELRSLVPFAAGVKLYIAGSISDTVRVQRKNEPGGTTDFSISNGHEAFEGHNSNTEARVFPNAATNRLHIDLGNVHRFCVGRFDLDGNYLGLESGFVTAPNCMSYGADQEGNIYLLYRNGNIEGRNSIEKYDSDLNLLWSSMHFPKDTTNYPSWPDQATEDRVSSASLNMATGELWSAVNTVRPEENFGQLYRLDPETGEILEGPFVFVEEEPDGTWFLWRSPMFQHRNGEMTIFSRVNNLGQRKWIRLDKHGNELWRSAVVDGWTDISPSGVARDYDDSVLLGRTYTADPGYTLARFQYPDMTLDWTSDVYKGTTRAVSVWRDSSDAAMSKDTHHPEIVLEADQTIPPGQHDGAITATTPDGSSIAAEAEQIQVIASQTKSVTTHGQQVFGEVTALEQATEYRVNVAYEDAQE
jgi:hypothetical protein